MKFLKPLLICTVLITLLSSCGGDGVFLFSLEDDVELGQQVDAEIEADPSFNILSESTHPDAYNYLNAMKQQILAGGEVKYADEFVWELHIIDNDTILNAFCTPGGFIYIYTGLINYLDDASSLAGVLGHEMAHADKRHSSKQMQQQYGISLLLGVLSGGEDPGLLAQISAGLVSLSFSRSHEKDADDSSVQYLCPTDFEADGAANFFQKIIDEGNPSPPQFLSTHPNPDNRVENIQTKAGEQDCTPQSPDPLINGITYAQFKALL